VLGDEHSTESMTGMECSRIGSLISGCDNNFRRTKQGP
jgi:hypothetical protein